MLFVTEMEPVWCLLLKMEQHECLTWGLCSPSLDNINFCSFFGGVGGGGGLHVIYSLYCVHWQLCMHSVDIIDIFPDLAESITLNSYFSDNFCKVLCLLGEKIWINLRRKHFFRSSLTSPKPAFEVQKGSKCYHFWYTSFNAVASLVLPISFSVAVRLVEIMNKKC